MTLWAGTPTATQSALQRAVLGGVIAVAQWHHGTTTYFLREVDKTKDSQRFEQQNHW